MLYIAVIKHVTTYMESNSENEAGDASLDLPGGWTMIFKSV